MSNTVGQICNILHLSHNLQQQLTRHMRSVVGLSFEQCCILWYISNKRNGITITELANETFRLGHTVSSMVSRLETLGLITRYRD